MHREPLETIADADGVPIGYVTAGDQLLADVLRRAHARELAEHARRAAVRRGDLPAEPWQVWHVSDRH
jgi:hypothetical protein